MVAVHDCDAVAALRAVYVKPVLRPTITLSLPPPFPANLLMKMLPILKMMPKTKTMPDIPIPDDPAVATVAADAETKKTEKKTETKKTETKKPKTMTMPTETETETEATKQKQTKHDEAERKTTKKLEEEEDPPKAPDNDIGVSPIDHPGYPEDGINFHPPPPSPIALHLQGPFPDG